MKGTARTARPQKDMMVSCVLHRGVKVSGHEVSWDVWRTVQGRAWSSSWQVFLSGQPWKKQPVSRAEVSSWEKPVGLLQSRDRRELICMPWRQPVSRALGGTQAAKLAVQTEGAFISPSWTSDAISLHPKPAGLALSVPAASWHRHKHPCWGVSGTWLSAAWSSSSSGASPRWGWSPCLGSTIF